MVALPLGKGAYERTYAGLPVIRLENRFAETSPPNQREHIALLSRPGTSSIAAFGNSGGTQYTRGTYSMRGMFESAAGTNGTTDNSGDLFVVSGPNLYRYSATRGLTQITGTIKGTGHPWVTWMKGIGYEYLFISDGTLLQYYAGGSQASGTLTLSGGSISNQVIQIDGVYYSWNASVDTNSPNGTASHPWLANPNSASGDPLAAMANLIDYVGIPGTDFSTALPGPATAYTAAAPDPSATGTLTATGDPDYTNVIQIGTTYYGWAADISGYADGTSAHPWLANKGTEAVSLANMAKLLNFNGTSGKDYSAALTAASTDVSATSDASHLYVTALVPGSGGNSIATTVLSGSLVSWGAATLTGGADTANTMVVTATSQYTDGNSISTTVVSGSFLSWGAATLAGGGNHSLHGVTVPPLAASQNDKSTNGTPGALATVSGYVLVAIANSQGFYFILPGATTIDPLNFAEKESNPDNIVDMITVGDLVMIMGQASTENWYASGNYLAPFAPVEGRVYMRGVVPGTPCLVKDSVIVVGDDGIVYEIGQSFGTTAQWGVHRISNHGIEERIRTLLRSQEGLVA